MAPQHLTTTARRPTALTGLAQATSSLDARLGKADASLAAGEARE